MKRSALWFVLALTALPLAAGSQEAGLKQLPARIELLAVPSVTLSDRHFLLGEGNATAVTVTGELRVAQGSGRLPVVVMLHGSGGHGANTDVWARELNALGISTFAIDSLSGRGLTRVATDQSLLGRLNMIVDAYGALDVLARHPRVDPRRIVLMGFSRGGQGALYASLKRFNAMWNKSGIEYAAHIAFYADCMTTYREETDITAHPVRAFHGGADDLSPASTCEAYVQRLKAAGHDAEFVEYPNAGHGFDDPLRSTTQKVSKGVQTVRNCRIREQSPGELINQATHAVFTYGDSCVEIDPKTGYDPAAAQQAHRTVTQFLVRAVQAKAR